MVDNIKPRVNNCYNCSKILSDREYCCSSCKSVYFCGKNCQIQYWKDHKQVCKAISTLTAQRQKEVFKRGSYTVNLSTKQKHKVTGLIGEKCLIKVLLNNKLSSVLLDTGAQVSVINDKYLRENFPHVAEYHVNELLDEPDSLRVQWGNQTDIPFSKYTVTNLCIGEGEDKYHLDVPFLITADQISNPILGFNTIKHIAQTTDDKLLIKLCQTSFDQTDVNRIQAFVNLLQTPDSVEATVKVKGKNTVVPAGCIVEIPCKANIGNLSQTQPMIFQQEETELAEGLDCADSIIMMKKGVNNYFKVPVVNSSDHDIILKKNMIMGRLEPITSLVPLEVELHQHSAKVSSIKANLEDTEEVQVMEKQQKSDGNSSLMNIPTVERQQKILSKIDLSGLTSKQREMVKNVIREEREVFSERDDDVGENKTYPMEINLKASNPVQLNYNSVPRNLCNELKMYIEDLLNKKWIVHSSSSYSSSVVVVRKKDGSIRMCCDYRKLNAKTIPDRHPLPRIQNILDNLGGNHYFTLLD